MKAPKLALVYSTELEQFHYPPDCPFKTERAGRFRQLIDSLGLLRGEGRIERAPQPAALAEVEQFHSPEYLAQLRRAARGELTVEALHMGLGGPDTPVFADMYEYPLWACGATLMAAEMILSGEADVVFNPSGGFHHAMAEKASGFCYLNDVVLGCLRLAGAGKRVLYVDIDVHHGDGVQEAFYDRDDVMTISLHESGRTLYPGTGFESEIGAGKGRGFCVNLPLPVGTYDEAYLRVFRTVVMPLARAFDPDTLVLEAGMDTLRGDPLAHLSLSNNVHVEIIGQLRSLQKPILMVGGGGYHVENTVRGWALLWQTLCGDHGEHDPSIGMGGVLLESGEWAGGLRDHAKAMTDSDRAAIDDEIQITIDKVKRYVFGIHGLPVSA